MRKKLVVIVGPTAVGKTDLSLSIAEKINGEIVSADSRLFYRGMDIGTAKPNLDERQRVRHHLIDVADPREIWSLAGFQRAAAAAIEEIHLHRKVPILVGGTGQYVRAVMQGWDLPAQEPDPKLRTVLEKWGSEIGPLDLHKRLACVDPEAAAVIDAPNIRRTIRALEVIFLTGKRFSIQRQRGDSPYDYFVIGLTRPRVELYERIDRRIDAMLAQGFVEEVRRLLESGVSPLLPSMSAIGYKQIADHLLGNCSLEESVTLIKRQTRIFVRRQAAWFRLDDPEISWFSPSAESESIISKQILDFLATPDPIPG